MSNIKCKCGAQKRYRYPGGDPENGPAEMRCVDDCPTQSEEDIAAATCPCDVENPCDECRLLAAMYPDDHENDPAYIAYLAECEEDMRLGCKCPKCGERKIVTTTTRTKNYGGGFDTYDKCNASGCDYAEVFV